MGKLIVVDLLICVCTWWQSSVARIWWSNKWNVVSTVVCLLLYSSNFLVKKKKNNNNVNPGILTWAGILIFSVRCSLHCTSWHPGEKPGARRRAKVANERWVMGLINRLNYFLGVFMALLGSADEDWQDTVWERAYDMQFRASGQIRILGRCSKDTASLHGARSLFYFLLF